MPSNRENGPPVGSLRHPPASLSEQDDRGHWPAIWTWTLLGPKREDRWTFSSVLSASTASTCQGWRLLTVASVPNAEGVLRSLCTASHRFRLTPIGLTPGD